MPGIEQSRRGMTWYQKYRAVYKDLRAQRESERPRRRSSVSSKKFRSEQAAEVNELNWREFVSITFIMHLPLNYWFTHITVIKKWGAFLVILSNSLTSIIFSVPLFMIYNFMGHYSKQSYIKYWNCVPILKGVAISIGLHSIILHIFDISMSGLALTYLAEMMKADLPWVSCDFEGSDENCMETLDYTVSHEGVTGHFHGHHCCNEFWANCSTEKLADSLAKYAPMDFYMGYMRGLNYDYTPKVKGWILRWVVGVLIVWIMILWCMLMGLHRCRKILCVMNQGILFVIVPLSLVNLYLNSHVASIEVVNSDFSNIFSFSFWIETTFASLLKEIPCEILAFSAISKQQISTTADSVTIYTMKMIFVAILTGWLSLCASLVQDHYNVSDIWCIKIEGDVLIFALIPDALQRWYFGQVCLLIYFIIIAYWGFSVGLYVCSAFMDAIFEELPALKKWKYVIFGAFCLTIGGCNMLMLTPHFVETFKDQLYHTLLPVKAALFFVSLMGLALYTMKRLKTDYYFTYGESLSQYCLQGAKLTVFILGALSVAAFIRTSVSSTQKPILVVLLLPILVGMVIVTYQFIRKMRETLFSADPCWGSPDFLIRTARCLHDPTYDLRHDVHQCTHHCLRKSASIQKETNSWKIQKSMFANRYSKDCDE